MRRMSRHTKRNNVVLLAIELEIDRVMALVAIDDEKTILSNSTRFGVLVKVLNLL